MSAGRRLALPLAVLVMVAACGGGRNVGRSNVLVNEGLSLQREGKLTEARDAYRRALRTDPKNKFALYDLGVLAQDAGQVNMAVGNFENALRIDPDFVPALVALAVLEAATEPQEAIKLYQRAVKLEPNQATPHFNLGLLLRSMGQAANGDAEVAVALRIEPALVSKLPADLQRKFSTTH